MPLHYNESTKDWELIGRVQTFSFYWTAKLGEAIAKASVKPYPIECHTGTEMLRAITQAVNQGIDSHLQAIEFKQGAGSHGRVLLTFSPKSVAILVRRLMESEAEESQSLAGDICGALGIELI